MIRIYIHAILYAADGARPFDDSVESDVTEFVKSVLSYKGVTCIDMSVMPDHIHLLMLVNPLHDLLKALETLRYWLQDFVLRHSNQLPFLWSNRIWLVSKSSSDVAAMGKFFRKQSAYHERVTAEQEWNDLLDWDEIDEEWTEANIARNNSVAVCDNLAFAE
jgi:REP element-mobilizing transposase RayT